MSRPRETERAVFLEAQRMLEPLRITDPQRWTREMDRLLDTALEKHRRELERRAR